MAGGGFGAAQGGFPQQPGQPQVPFQSIPGVYPGMGYPAPQPFNPEGTDAGPRPFESPYPLNPMQVQPGSVNPQLEAFKQMFQGQPQTQPFNPYNRPGQPPPFPGFGGNQVYAGGTPNFNEATGQYNPRPVQTQPVKTNFTGQLPPQRGLGGLQIDKFKNRLGQR